MNYSIPKYKNLYFREFFATKAAASDLFAEAQQIMNKAVATFGQFIQKSPKGHFLHRYGTNIPFDNVADIRLAFFIGAYLNSRSRGAEVLEMLLKESTTVSFDSETKFKGIASTEAVISNSLEESLRYLYTFSNPTLFDYNGLEMNKIRAAIDKVKVTKYNYDEDTINVVLLNSLTTVVRNYNMAFGDNGEFPVKLKKIDLWKAFMEDKLEDVFEAWMDSQTIEMTLTQIQELGKVETGDVKYGNSGMTLDVAFYQRIIDKSFDMLFSRTNLMHNWRMLKDRFITERRKYALIHAIKQKAQIEADTKLSLTVGFHTGRMCMEQSNIDDFMKNFNGRFATFIPYWEEFVTKFLVSGVGNLYPSSSVRWSIINNQKTIYHITWHDPYSRNNVLYYEDQRFKKLADLGTSKHAHSVEDLYPIKSYEGDNSEVNYCTPAFIKLMSMYARDQIVYATNLDTNEYEVMFSETVNVVVPPSNVELEFHLLHRPKKASGKSFVPMSVKWDEMSMYDLMFQVRESDMDSLDSTYRKRLRELGAQYEIGPVNYIENLDVKAVGVKSEAQFLATLGRFPAEAYVRACNIHLELPKPYTLVNRMIELPKTQVLTFPVTRDNLSEYWYDRAEDCKEYGEGFKGTKEFAVKKEAFSGIQKEEWIGKATVDIGRDVNFAHFHVIGDDPDKYKFLYAPELAPKKQRIAIATLGTESLHDYYEIDPMSDNAMKTLMSVVMALFTDCNDAIIPATVLKKKLDGLIRFIKRLNPEGRLTDAGITDSVITWKQLREVLEKVAKVKVDSKQKGGMLAAYTTGIYNLFESEGTLWHSLGYTTEYSMLGDVYQALEDKHNGVIRAINGYDTATGLSGHVVLDGLENPTPIRQLILSKLNRRLESAFDQQISLMIKNGEVE